MLEPQVEQGQIPASAGRRQKIGLREISRMLAAALLGAFFSVWIQGAQAERTALYGGHSPAEKVFFQALQELRSNYVEELDESRLWERLTRCATAQLDPYSYFLNPEQKTRHDRGTRFGLSISRRPGSSKGPPLVVALQDDGPAQRAGVQLGMRVDAIDGRSTRRFRKQSDLDLLLMPSGRSSLNIRSGKRAFTLRIDEKSERHKAIVDAQEFDCGSKRCLYLKVAAFVPGVARDLRRLLKGEERPQWGGVALDLRNNPGGEIAEAVAVADLFLGSGVITRMRGRGGKLRREIRASAEQALRSTVPLVVMIDEYSASAAELLAAALQDHNRALVVGEPSFGKGSVQAMHHFSNGALLRYSSARYFSPHDHAIDHRGIRPDLHIHAATKGQREEKRSLMALFRRWKKRPRQPADR